MGSKEVTSSLFSEPVEAVGRPAEAVDAGSEAGGRAPGLPPSKRRRAAREAAASAAGVGQAEVSHIIRVAMESGADAEFDYAVAEELWPIQVGQRVEVPFGKSNKVEVGFCIDSDVPPEGSLPAASRRLKLRRPFNINCPIRK